MDFEKLHEEPWNVNRKTRAIIMPDGSKRLATLPAWAWLIFDRLPPRMAENQIFFAHSETMRSHRPEALDYFLAAGMHASERRDQKMAYYHWLLEERVIPGTTRIAANDHYHPETMPVFPDPWYYEWNCWNRRRQRLQQLFPQTA